MALWADSRRAEQTQPCQEAHAHETIIDKAVQVFTVHSEIKFRLEKKQLRGGGNDYRTWERATWRASERVIDLSAGRVRKGKQTRKRESGDTVMLIVIMYCSIISIIIIFTL